jgi:hypothetical protein
VRKMARHFCDSGAYTYSSDYYSAKNQARSFSEAIFQKGRNLRLIATIAAVPAEVTLENARNDEERALVQAALKAGEQLVFRIPNKTIHNWKDGYAHSTPQKTICRWADKLTSLDNTGVRINSPRDISPQMVRDLLQRPEQFHALHAISKPEHAEDNRTLQAKIFGPLQEALEDLNGPHIDQFTKDRQVHNLLKLQQVARGELLGLEEGGSASGLKLVMCNTGWRDCKPTRGPTLTSKAKFEAFRAVARDILQAAKIPNEEISRLTGGNHIPDAFIIKMLLNPRQAVEDIKVDIDARKVNVAQNAAENTRPEVSGAAASASYSQARNGAEAPAAPPLAPVIQAPAAALSALCSFVTTSAFNPGLTLNRVWTGLISESEESAHVENGREQLRSQLSNQLPIDSLGLATGSNAADSGIPTVDISRPQGTTNAAAVSPPGPAYTSRPTYLAGDASGSSSRSATPQPTVHRASASAQQVASRRGAAPAPARATERGFVVTPLPLINPVGVGLRATNGIIPVMPVVRIGGFRLL